MPAGRPNEQGLDYWSFPTNTFDIDNPENQMLKEQAGDSGLMCWFQIQTAIYKQGHFLRWDLLTRRAFRIINSRDEDDIKNYLELFFNMGLLSRKMFEEYEILTSENIQQQYIKMVKRRGKVMFYEQFTLVDFETFQSTPPIYYYDKDGNLLEKFKVSDYKKVSKDNQKSKNKTVAKKLTPVVPEPIAAEVPKFKPHTKADVVYFISLSYYDHCAQDELFQDTYDQKDFDDYVLLNKKIDRLYPNVRVSKRQLTFPEYIEFCDTNSPRPTLSAFEAAYLEINKRPVEDTSDIYQLLGIYLPEPIRETAALGPPPDLQELQEKPPGYPIDEVFEKKVLDFWALNQVTHHKMAVYLRDFLTVLHQRDQLNYFKRQFDFYVQYVELNGASFKIHFKNFLGKQSERFEDARWLESNWEEMVNERGKPNAKKATTAQGKPSKAEAATNRHQKFKDMLRNNGQQ